MPVEIIDGHELITAHASFAPGQCIKLSSDGGFRLVLDIPENCSDAVKRLMDWRTEAMLVAFRIEDSNQAE